MVINIQNPCNSKNPFISFCIPTYNRSVKVSKLVLELLKFKSDNIEVVVIDNRSSDDTDASLSLIKDNRFHFYENERNFGGIVNGLIGITKCKGNYVFFCLDKDFIHHEYILELINFLKCNEDIAVGFCSLNTVVSKESIIYTKGIEALNGIAYLSKHATGIFLKNEYLFSVNILDRFSDIKKVGGFALDFISAELCLLGNAAFINIPLCTTETGEEAKKIKSLTYSGNGDAFFLPERRYDLFENYVIHIAGLNISELNKRSLVKRVFHQELINATIGFKNICLDSEICAHYNLKPRNVGIIKLFKIDFVFSSKFIQKCPYRSKSSKLLLCMQVHIEIIAKNILKLKNKLMNKISNFIHQKLLYLNNRANSILYKFVNK